MNRLPAPRHASGLAARLATPAAGIVLACAAVLAGCSAQKVAAPVEPKPVTGIGDRHNLPAYMKGTIWEHTDVDNVGLFPVTSYGLVTGLRGGGDCFAPTPVRDWISKEMIRHGFASRSAGDYAALTPERVLNDPNNAIVIVGGYLPPGARRGQRFDVQVQALPGNNTASLAHGLLFSVELRLLGANPQQPGGSVNVFAAAEGHILVNPAYARDLNTPSSELTAEQATQRASLRVGTIPNGAIAQRDRPLHLVLRQPQWQLSRAIEGRIVQQFQDHTVAAAQNEKVVWLYPPDRYVGDWEHFVGVATHLYLNGTPEYLDQQAARLAAEAEKPDAALQDICYCLEGIGRRALPALTPLFASKKPEVQFAAAQAAAYIGDRAGQDLLMEIAGRTGHPFQLNAVRVLGQLPASEVVKQTMARLLDYSDPQVRVEAYKVLSRAGDPRIWSEPIGESFMLDLVPTDGPPLVYASRVGEPRLALFAPRDRRGKPQMNLTLPITFTAFDNKLSIASELEHPRNVTIFYRGEGGRTPQPVVSTPDLPRVIAVLAGKAGSTETNPMRFGYGDIVAMVKSLCDGEYLAAPFKLQELPADQDDNIARPQAGSAPPQASAK